MYLGGWKIDDVITFYANTTRFDTGAATDADSVPTYRIFEDETSTPILTGSMALLDSSNTAGFYSEQITLSAANGFEKGKSYAIYKQATVNGVTGATHDTLQIEPEVDANRINWANVDNASTTVNLSGTTVKTAADVETDTQDIQSRLPAALTAGGNITADIQAITGSTHAATALGAMYGVDGIQYTNVASATPTTLTMGFLTPPGNDFYIGGVCLVYTGTGAKQFRTISGNTGNVLTVTPAWETNPSSDSEVIILPASIASAAGAANIRAAVGLASANLDTQLDALPTAVENADAVLSRGVSNVEDTANTTSLAAIILAILESSVSGTTWTIRKTGGTTFVTKTVTVDAAADPITGVT